MVVIKVKSQVEEIPNAPALVHAYLTLDLLAFFSRCYYNCNLSFLKSTTQVYAANNRDIMFSARGQRLRYTNFIITDKNRVCCYLWQ